MSIPLISIYFFNVVNYSSLLACKMFYFIFVVNYKVVDLLVFFQIPQELPQSNICAKSYGKKNTEIASNISFLDSFQTCFE